MSSAACAAKVIPSLYSAACIAKNPESVSFGPLRNVSTVCAQNKSKTCVCAPMPYMTGYIVYVVSSNQ